MNKKSDPWANLQRIRELQQSPEALAERLQKLLRRGQFDLLELSQRMDVSVRRLKQAIGILRARGFNVQTNEKQVEIVRNLPVGGELRINPKLYTGRKYRFGVTSDNHLGSRYARLDVLGSIYDCFAREGVRDVYNCGNWVDGLCSYNQFDLLPGCQSLEGQLAFFCKNYPRRKGMKTFFIAGDDHEGWWTQRVGIDIGTLMQQHAEAAGRDDLQYIGYLEADVRISAPRGDTWIRLMHPGGGSPYAVSYVPQKIVESFQGGEKPMVLLIGHHHKLYFEIHREVWCVGAGCTQDQTPFMRKRKIEAHVGGAICEIEQARDGHVSGMTVKLLRFYDRKFYEQKEKYPRW